MDPKILSDIENGLKAWNEDGKFTAFRIESSPDPTVYIRSIGKEIDPEFVSELRANLSRHGVRLDDKSQRETYYLLSQEYPSRLSFSKGPHPDSDLVQELRPGSGILRFVGGVPKGPAGTLTCFLSSEDGSDVFLLAAGHVVSDFWKECPSPQPKSSIYHNPKGFPSTNSTRSIGKMIERSELPAHSNSPVKSSTHRETGFPSLRLPAPCFPEDKCEPRTCYSEASEPEEACYLETCTCCTEGCYSEADIDVAIVSVVGEFEWKQRTTCYGTFGEVPEKPKRPKIGTLVMKCGSEETHWTYAYVICKSRPVLVYGPDGVLYEFHGQVILGQVDCPPDKEKCEESEDPVYPMSSFAVPGDSGTMVVDYESRRPLGMLIAGSILDGKFVMTPIREIARFWKKRGYVFLRA